MSCINLERAFTKTLFHWLCICCIRIEDNLILAIPPFTFVTGVFIYTHQFRSSFPALWGICCSSEWAQSECKLRSAGLCPQQSQLLGQAPLAGVWSDHAANMVHQRNLRWLGQVWGLTGLQLHGWVRKIPSCLSWRKWSVCPALIPAWSCL